MTRTSATVISFLAYQDGWLGIDDDFCNIYEGHLYRAL